VAFRISKGIDVFLTPQKYESTLKNHSQYIRWRRSQLCYCIDPVIKQPDVNCADCKGRGRIYSYQSSIRVQGEESVHNLETVRVKNAPITKVHSVLRDLLNTRYAYTVAGFSNDTITIAPSPAIQDLPKNWESITVDYEYSTLTAHTEIVTYNGQLTVALNILQVETGAGEKIWCDIARVRSVVNVSKANINITARATEYALNNVYFSAETLVSELGVGDTLQITVDVVRPYNFALIGVSEKMMYEDAYAVTGGQAYAVVPYHTYVGVGDLFTQAVGESRGDELITYLTSQYDYELSAFDVRRIIGVKDATGVAYQDGVHYVLEKRNRIRFIHPTVHPTNSTKVSISYLYNPTFAAIPDKPLVRAGENQRFPRRVNLVVYDKVNPMFDANMINKW
jgi:hypothetical protein